MGDLDRIEKGDKTVNGQYRFVSHDQVTEKIQRLLIKYKVNTIPTVKEIRQDNNRTIVNLQVTFVNAEQPTDNFSVEFTGYGVDNGDKGPGKAISYAYKYAILKTFNIPTGDDPDKDAHAKYEPEKCAEFNDMLPKEFKRKDHEKVNQFLKNRAEVLGKHVEDIKREAIKRMDAFLEAVKKWNPNDE